MQEVKQKIQFAIDAFNTGDLFYNATALFNTLGYNTSRQNRMSGNTYKDFKDSFIETDDHFNEEKALSKEWKIVELLFQLTNEEVTKQGDMFFTDQVNDTIIESYLFFAIELKGDKGDNYSRTKLAQITREINKLFSMNVFQEVSVYPVVSIFLKKCKSNSDVFPILQPINRKDKVFVLDDFKRVDLKQKLLTLLEDNLWGFLLSDKAEYLQKVVEGTSPLSAYGSINATSTASESDKFTSLISEVKEKFSLQLINTGTIDRYQSLWGAKHLRHGGRNYLNPYLNTSDYRVNSRRVSMYSSPKIIFAKMASVCEAFLDSQGKYASINTNCFYSPHKDVSLKFIECFANSKIFMFLYQQLFGALRMSGGYFQFQAPQLRVIPTLHPLKPNDIAIFENLNHKRHHASDDEVDSLENEIDLLVYKLYGLDYKDVKVIDPNIESIISEEDYNMRPAIPASAKT